VRGTGLAKVVRSIPAIAIRDALDATDPELQPATLAYKTHRGTVILTVSATITGRERLVIPTLETAILDAKGAAVLMNRTVSTASRMLSGDMTVLIVFASATHTGQVRTVTNTKDYVTTSATQITLATDQIRTTASCATKML
jgi:hypothetical protein